MGVQIKSVIMFIATSNPRKESALITKKNEAEETKYAKTQ